MNKYIASIFTFVFLSMPFIASADALSDRMDEMRFGLFREAAAQAAFDPLKPTCIVKTSTSSVKVHEPFLLAWGAWGSQDSELNKNTWAPTGAFMVAVDKPGTYKYQFKFYGVGDTQALCQAIVSVK